MRKKTAFIFGGAVLAAAVAGAAWLSVDPPGETALVARRDVRLHVEAQGKLEAAVAYDLGPPSVEGMWNHNLAWMIAEGARVAQGDVVARFDATEIEERLRTQQAVLETTMQEREKEERSLAMRLEQLQLDLVKAEGDLKELDIALDVPEGLLSRLDIEQKRLEQRLAGERLRFLREKIAFEREVVRTKLELLDVKRASAETRIAQHEAAKAKFAVRAPVAGIVINIPKGRGGDRWEVGESVWMLAKVLRVADVSSLRVEAAVLEAEAARIVPGQPAEITVDALPGRVLRTQVAEIGRVVRERSQQDRTKVVDIVLAVPESDLVDLRPGMGVRVTIETGNLPARLVVPLEAVRATPEGVFVDVVMPRGRIERRRVTLGERAAQDVIVETGLEEGERVLAEESGGNA